MAEKRIYAVVWTWRSSKTLKTKKRALEVMKVWKRAYERQGWNVNRLGPDAYAATSPEGERHSIVFHEYDAATKQRVYPEFRPKIVKEPTEAPVVRKGRATPAWA